MTEIVFPSGERRPYIHHRGQRGLFPPVGAGVVSLPFGPGDSLDGLALNYLGSETLWWQIAEANLILFPEIDPDIPTGVGTLSVGGEIFIPARGSAR